MKMNPKKMSVFLALAVFASVSVAIDSSASTYYIDPDQGDNTNDGLSVAKPKRDWSAVKIESGIVADAADV
jgi:hypothetical protein